MELMKKFMYQIKKTRICKIMLIFRSYKSLRAWRNKSEKNMKRLIKFIVQSSHFSIVIPITCCCTNVDRASISRMIFVFYLQSKPHAMPNGRQWNSQQVLRMMRLIVRQSIGNKQSRMQTLWVRLRLLR